MKCASQKIAEKVFFLISPQDAAALAQKANSRFS
jgi:hypothetical protein